MLLLAKQPTVALTVDALVEAAAVVKGTFTTTSKVSKSCRRQLARSLPLALTICSPIQA